MPQKLPNQPPGRVPTPPGSAVKGNVNPPTTSQRPPPPPKPPEKKGG